MRRLSSCLLAAIVVACSKAPAPHEELAGEWRAGFSFTPAQRKALGESAAADVEKSMLSVALTIKRSGDYTLWLAGARIEGRVALRGDLATFTPTMVNGRPLEEVRAEVMARLEKNPDKDGQTAVEHLLKPDLMRLSADKNTLTSAEPEDLKEGTGYFKRVVPSR